MSLEEANTIDQYAYAWLDRIIAEQRQYETARMIIDMHEGVN